MPETKQIKIFRALVVEDDDAVAQFVIGALGRYNFFIRHAADGRFALKCLKEEFFDIMLCDIMMPYIDGFKLLETTRNQGILTPPLLMLSALSDKEAVLKSKSLGAAAYLAKPATSPQLVAKVKEVMKISDEVLVDKFSIPFGVGSSMVQSELQIHLTGCPQNSPLKAIKDELQRRTQLAKKPSSVLIRVSSDFAYELRSIGYLEELARHLHQRYSLSRHSIRFTGMFFAQLSPLDRSKFESEHIITED